MKQNIEMLSMLENAEKAAAFLKQLANPARLLVLCHLVNGPLCVSELEKITGLSQSALSQHLAKLRRDNFVKTQKEGQHVYYQLAEPNVQVILTALQQMFCDDI